MTDTTITTDQTLDGLLIDDGDRYILSPSHNITLTIAVNYANTTVPDNMILVMGTLVSHPDSTHTHNIVFTGIDERLYVGGPVADHMNPPTTDPGIYVVMSGVLDLVGQTRTGWTNAATDPADWVSGDTKMAAAWGTTGTTEAISYTLNTITSLLASDPSNWRYTTNDGTTHYRERFNLTRNLNITASGGFDLNGGTTLGGFGHLMIMSDQPQTIQYVAFNHWGPAVFSRWTVHFHRVLDGSRGTVVTGCVSNESRGHVYVPHGSYGITFFDCISYHSHGDVFWYDSQDNRPAGQPETYNAPLDVVMDHCGVFSAQSIVIQIPNDPNEKATSGIGFLLETVVENFTVQISNCVVAGTPKGSAGPQKAGYHWSSHGAVGSDAFNFFNNVAHNCDRGFSVWQNDKDPHFAGWEGGIGGTPGICGYGWWNGWTNQEGLPNEDAGGWLNGAYANSYHVSGLVLDDHIEATSVVPDRTEPQGQPRSYSRQTWVDCSFYKFMFGGVEPLTCKDRLLLQFCKFGKYQLRDDIHTPSKMTDPAHIQAVIDAGGDEFLDPDRVDRGGQLAGLRDIECKYVDFVGCDGITASAGARLDAGGILVINKNNDSIMRLQTKEGLAFHAKWGTFPNIVLDVNGNHYDQIGNGTEVWEAIAPFTLYVTTASILTATSGVAYSQTLNASLGTTPYTWSLASGTLPTGLTLSSGGVISGTPTQTGTFPITVEVRDNNGFNDLFDGGVLRRSQKTYSLVVGGSAVLQVSTTSLPNGAQTVAYSQQLARTGGTAPFTWSLASGSLPAGLSLSAGGLISGTPTTVQNPSFTVRVTDGVASTATRTLSINVVSINPTITTSGLPTGAVNVSYSLTMAATGGTGPYTWTVVGGTTLPVGLTLSSAGLISGIPTVEGSTSVRIGVTDSLGHTDAKTYPMTISPPLLFPAVTLDPTNVGKAYSYTFAATGGVPPYIYAGTNVPNGLSLSLGGVLSGSTTATGTQQFQVTVLDSAGTFLSIFPSLLVRPSTHRPGRGVSNRSSVHDVQVR